MARRPVTDEVLLEAVRQRLLDEVRKQERMAPVVNNVYGGHVPSSQGVAEQMGQPEADPGLFDYFVDIERSPLMNPATGTAVEGAWKKKVHRYRTPKSDLTDDGMKKKKRT